MAAPEAGLWVTRGADAPVDYPDDHHSQLAGIEDESAWYAERNHLVAQALAAEGMPTRLVEVGAGNGVVAAYLRRLGVDAVAVEPGRGAAEACVRRGVPTVCGMLEDLKLPTGSLEAVGVFDVLEHLADPAPLLAEIHRALPPGGRLAVTVPAMPALWSRSDVFAGHHRRYSRAGLISDLAAAGFCARSCRYIFGVLVPAVGLLRAAPDRLGRHRSKARQDEVGTSQVAGYGRLGRAAARRAFAAERALRRAVDLPVGTSLLGVFARSDEEGFA